MLIQTGWDNLGLGAFDTLVKDYAEDMQLVMPGQSDTLKGR
ncbi:hypothetical protein [Shewanella insulae]|nr:hypothetical protein [Shewanella insulae]